MEYDELQFGHVRLEISLELTNYISIMQVNNVNSKVGNRSDGDRSAFPQGVHWLRERDMGRTKVEQH